MSTSIWRIFARLNIPLYPEFSANSGYKGIFSLTVLVSSNSSCHPLGSIFGVLGMFFGRRSASSSLKVWNCFTIFYQNNWANATLSQGLSVTVHFSCDSRYYWCFYHYYVLFIYYRKRYRPLLRLTVSTSAYLTRIHTSTRPPHTPHTFFSYTGLTNSHRLTCVIDVMLPDVANVLQIWSTLAGVEELAGGFE